MDGGLHRPNPFPSPQPEDRHLLAIEAIWVMVAPMQRSPPIPRRRPLGTWAAGWLAIFGLSSSACAEIWRGQAEIAFEATSTLHDFSGAAKTDPFALSVVLDGTQATLGGTVTVAVAQLDTRHARRDENMRKMFDSARFPLAVGVLENLRIETRADSPASLDLTIRGRTTTVPAQIRNWRMENGSLRFDGEMTLSLEELGLSPPVLLGFITVGDAVKVRVRAALEQTP